MRSNEHDLVRAVDTATTFPSRHGRSRSHDNDWITTCEHHRDGCSRVIKSRVIVDAKTEVVAGMSEHEL